MIPPSPQLIFRYSAGLRAVEIWTTTCIVTNFGKRSSVACTVLINPANPQLSGVRNFPYFPRGGPVPHIGGGQLQPRGAQSHYASTTWGGMEAGEEMMFPASVIDGLVHLYGGPTLQAECAERRAGSAKLGDESCSIGTAVETTAGRGALRHDYDRIIHTAPPFYQPNDANNALLLSKCYVSSLQIACGPTRPLCDHDDEAGIRVAVPLLGAGARGFPHRVAIDVAAQNAWEWCHQQTRASERKVDGRSTRHLQTWVFGLLDTSIARRLVQKYQRVIGMSS